MKLLILIQSLYIIYLLSRIKHYRQEIEMYENLRSMYVEMIRWMNAERLGDKNKYDDSSRLREKDVKTPCNEIASDLAISSISFCLHLYMASCHVAMGYRIRLLSQGPGRIFLTENLHPALWLPDCSTSSGMKKV